MKASVVIPAWGETPYLDETKDCLAAQTFRDFEVVVAAPPKDEPNAGAARNEGLALTRGEWLFFGCAWREDGRRCCGIPCGRSG